MNKSILLFAMAPMVSSVAVEVETPSFRVVEIDSDLEIGYGVALADIDGDGKLDIVLADKNQFAWYENPSWQKRIMVENLTERDHVCLAARDINGDGKAEVVVGAQWNPGETTDETQSGSVHFLIPSEDRTGPWAPVQLHHEPTVHRMRWIETAPGEFELVVLPLHGRGNKGGEGAGVKVFAYKMPENPRDPWEMRLIDDRMHKTHNMDPAINVPESEGEETLLVAGAEGVFVFRNREGEWRAQQIVKSEEGEAGSLGAGEVRTGNLPEGRFFVTTVEPMHGNQLVAYTFAKRSGGNGLAARNVLFDGMVDGHALACGDLLTAGYDQVVVGWRGNRDDPENFGIKLFIPQDPEGKEWRSLDVDSSGMACEDLKIGDLNGDGRSDIVACGRSTNNLRIYFNESQ